MFPDLHEIKDSKGLGHKSFMTLQQLRLLCSHWASRKPKKSREILATEICWFFICLTYLNTFKLEVIENNSLSKILDGEFLHCKF